MVGWLKEFTAVERTKERQDILESKVGTCESFTDEEAAPFGVDEADMGVFMEMWDVGFLCEECGWWWEMCDLSESEGMICTSCIDEH